MKFRLDAVGPDGDNDVKPPGMVTAADALTSAMAASTPTTTQDDGNAKTARNRPPIARTPFPAYGDSPHHLRTFELLTPRRDSLSKADRVVVPGRYRRPVGVGADPHWRPPFGGSAIAELAILVVAPGPE